ncbi:hypothetical protein THAOC_16415 [Thalassiosira oceanica]|uniref:Uncharacterized protein n=1 Tax=Thalassiosira oceanica TaxID=159749 RepID=K0SC71_THAOC|nr:hypothetical protein THAOC_16415 [Thalassiosira oceanica]|eukprot:EJK62955.1 hypothetical protein THAOC_16415 [Thalassiosira oceanica]
MVAQAPTPTIQQEGRGARSGGAPKPLLVKTQQSASTLDEQRLRDELRKMLREELVAMSRQPDPAAGPGPDELLDAIGEKSFLRQRGSTHEDQLVSMPGDVFSLMCVSPATSQAFAYGLAVFAAKLFFYSVILFDICKSE